MSVERYAIRPRFVSPNEGGGHHGSTAYQVFDGAQVIETLPTQTEAAKRVMALGGRIRLAWERTVIGGRTAPRDFSARLGDLLVGRIYHVLGGSTTVSEHWFWTMNAFTPPRLGNVTGKAGSKDDAVIDVEREFTRFLAGPPPYK